MKKHIPFIFVVALFCAKTITAQTSVTRAAAYGVTVPSNACLSCPGSNWNNEMDVVLADGIPASTDLNQNGFCFQSACFYSRNLDCSQFGFTVPAGATILGIEVNILRNAPAINIIKDTSITILQNGITSSSDYKSATYWPLAYTTEVYGGPTDLWGLTWTPADVNNSATAVAIKIYNKDPAAISGINVDYVSMTVYYSVATGIVESQTSTPNSFSAYQTNANSVLCSFVTTENTNIKLNLFDLSGKLVYSKDLGTASAGSHQETIPTAQLQSGIYLLQYSDKNKVISKKISIQKD